MDNVSKADQGDQRFLTFKTGAFLCVACRVGVRSRPIAADRARSTDTAKPDGTG